ncbi:MAG: hypothetical protein GW949_03890 [Spirochaetales bacterium]|nr:hypothetical protein [Spirochaetales bacterium]
MKSAETGMSQNKTVKLILSESLLKDKRESRREALRELFGTWTNEDVRDFQEATKDLSQTDHRDWE